jgi:N-methylhydantoinase B
VSSNPHPYRLALFRNRLEGLAEEMGRSLGRSAFSPNIRERLDFSCALFGGDGTLLAQAAHIPVHLGSLPDLVREIASRPQKPGDCWIANSPYIGGTHLPDLTLVLPVHEDDRLVGFTASRAHHSDVGGMTPGSMPNSQEVFQEGLILPPCRLLRRGKRCRDVWNVVLANVRTPEEREGDLRAQIAACRLGASRLLELRRQHAPGEFEEQTGALLDYAERQIAALLEPLGHAEVHAEEVLDWGEEKLPLHLSLHIGHGRAVLDLRRCADPVAAPINATRAITCAAAYFPFFCLAHHQHGRVVVNSGSLRRLEVLTRPGSLLQASPPYPVCAGNVETSQRVCDLVWKALAQLWPELVPAQAASTMNNLTIGNSRRIPPFTYYETCGGGHGASAQGPGVSGQQVAMTNTRNTPAEVLETYYPLRLWRYGLRSGSGGDGAQPGGEGVVRELELLAPAQVNLLASRRTCAPSGSGQGAAGEPGIDHVQLPGEDFVRISPPWSEWLPAGSRLRLQTPGGGGWSPGNSDSVP